MARTSKKDDLGVFYGLMQDRDWRINHLYSVIGKDKNPFRFSLNWAQRRIHENFHPSILVLKARQLGITTYFQLVHALDSALFTPNREIVLVAQRDEDMRDLFFNKIRYPLMNIGHYLHPALRNILRKTIVLKEDTQTRFVFGNGSSITASMKGRGGTPSTGLITELGTISRDNPIRAKDIVSGLLNAIPHDNGLRVIESTANGKEGVFFNMATTAIEKNRSGEPLGDLDYKFFFFPWWMHPEYTYDGHINILGQHEKYFADLKYEHGIELTDGQKRWYAIKERDNREDMFREYPSTPEEAFKGAVEGGYFTRELSIMEREERIGRFPHNPRYPVHTAWDLGRSDNTAIILFQKINNLVYCIDCYTDTLLGIPDYCAWLTQRARAKGYTYGKHLWPSDGVNGQMATKGAQELRKIAKDLGYPVILGRNPAHQNRGLKGEIDRCRMFMSGVCIDGGLCGPLVDALKNYVMDWSKATGEFLDRPKRNFATHFSTAFILMAQLIDKVREGEAVDYSMLLPPQQAVPYDPFGGI